MTAIISIKISRRDRNMLLFRIAAGLIAVGLLLVDGIGILAPWFDLKCYRAVSYEPALQRWHDARWGAYAGILLIGSLLALLWRPGARPLLLQFLVLSAAVLSAITVPFDPFAGIIRTAAIALLVALYPHRDTLARFPWPDRLSRPLLALSMATAVLLALDAWLSIRSALARTHAIDRGPAEAIILAATLVLASLLAATKRPGWQALGLLSGTALIYLGLAAAKLPAQPGAWGATGAALATLGGWAYVGATWWEARRTIQDSAAQDYGTRTSADERG
jgi:hypothetical protein